MNSSVGNLKTHLDKGTKSKNHSSIKLSSMS